MKEIEKIENAIDQFETYLACHSVGGEIGNVGAYVTALRCLQSELDRQENKALTLSELTELEGQKVYKVPKITKEMIYEVTVESTYDDDTICTSMNGEKSGHTHLSRWNFYKHKPNGGE